MFQLFRFFRPWKRIDQETALEYVERVGGWKGSNMKMMQVLQSDFGMTRDDAKVLSMRSRSFWRSFFLKHAKEIFNANGSRFAATNFIRRKNDPFGNGSALFSEEEIDDLVDSVGKWPR